MYGGMLLCGAPSPVVPVWGFLSFAPNSLGVLSTFAGEDVPDENSYV